MYWNWNLPNSRNLVLQHGSIINVTVVTKGLVKFNTEWVFRRNLENLSSKKKTNQKKKQNKKPKNPVLKELTGIYLLGILEQPRIEVW